MAVNDVLSDMIARINNAQAAKLATSKVINSKMSKNVLNLLQEEGFIAEYKEIEGDKNHLTISLKYDMGKPIINEFKRISKPGRRVYSSVIDLPRFFNGLGVVVLSTSKGILADHQAREQNIGGELLCAIF